MARPLAYVHLSLARTKSSGHANFDCEYLANDSARIAISNK